MRKKRIAILGSTGSIGKSLINIIKKDKKNFEIVLLAAESNYKELLKQAKYFKVKNLIIKNINSFEKVKNDKYSKKINIYKNFNIFKKIFKKKIDYTMSSISGLQGLEPTINIIKYTKKIAIANKEAIICGWGLINKNLTKYNTKFVPVDSEHFSTWYGIRHNKDIIKKIYLTASGGPFLDLPLYKFKKIKIKDALKHPNWRMGKKISIDSSTMMNKVFEIIEAKKIFDIKYNQLSILTNPNSYVHSIIHFNNGLIKLIAHSTDMKIPIKNTLYENENYFLNSNSIIEINKLNNLNLKKINSKKFPFVKIIKNLPERNSLYETILVSANDELVNQFLRKKISYTDINLKMFKVLKYHKFNKYKKKKPRKIEDILKLSNYVRSKIISKSI
tara:strand:+ start:177 stop:1343 length:1167 start_codon:yes stop_codon:yes gene_type:complete